MSKIRVADYIVQYLVEYGVKDVFIVTGGGAMHLNDAIGKNKAISYFCNHHEQACAIAAEGYARVAEKLAVVFVTTGPGGLNTLTGVMGQWTDSVPVLYISGQVKYETTIDSCRSVGLRQLGDQEVDIISVVKPLTKYAEMVKDPKEIQRMMHQAITMATTGRPGPVWLDVPLNVQGSLIDEAELQPVNLNVEEKLYDVDAMHLEIHEVAKLLSDAQRPVIVAGNGVRISNAVATLLEFAEKNSIPLLTSFLGCDTVPTAHACFVGRIGTIGNRPGNFCLQNADFVLTLGTRNNIRQVSYNWKPFARSAKKVFVDIDAAELEKPTVFPDIKVHADVGAFLKGFTVEILKSKLPDWTDWLAWCNERKRKYSAYLPEYAESKPFVHPYHFVNEFNKCLQSDDIIVTGNATPSIVYFQMGAIEKNQRAIWNSGCAAMGYDLPASIGAAVAAGKRRVICFAGDGSLQMNVQELQTVSHYKLPIKIFIFENNGYISIRQTQENLFERHYVGCSPSSGVSFPDFSAVLNAYSIPTVVIDSHDGLKEKIEQVLLKDGSVGCVVKLNRDYKFSPKTSSERLPDGRMVSKPLEDMFPFLSREEFKENMLVPEWSPEN